MSTIIQSATMNSAQIRNAYPDGSAPLHQRVPAEKLAKLVFQLLFEPQPTKAVAQLARIRIIRQTSLYQAVACKHADSLPRPNAETGLDDNTLAPLQR
ncbi:hypothetical protein P4129_01725 [Pseudomonas aeruginosa]|nr:hypothetical protein [Pseudomonas aeruginosa]